MPKKVETEPITDDEWLYRRIHKDRFRNNRTPFVSPSAFEPRTKGNAMDHDGISFYRADCLNHPADILAMITDPEKRPANGIVKVSVAEVKEMGLTVTSTPQADIRGHVSILELSAANYLDECFRAKCKIWMHKLAELTSPEDRIVVKPEI
jgi:hypothetical protein